ncbi:hypothetical protein GCG21_09045 [Pseudactinotalea sp. HY160]|uniref:hypothetical protein n=1 Tax=Pseudactinotalea sp. HY160 TaxID=2654490 RepID=UPI00128D59BC|nr:hypothetical protein [Pseudactinotalea sp. HY160]MPV50148.1 hypothetical protein [Pseudactinotalea sp. HY160]
MMRHRYIDELCSLLESVVLGREAEKVLRDMPNLGSNLGSSAGSAAGSAGNGDVSLFVLPVWGWAHSRIDVGRKDLIPSTGGRYLLPVRLRAYPSHVIVSATATVAHFVGVGMGHGLAGHTTCDPAAAPGVLPDGTLTLPATWGPVASGGAASSGAASGGVRVRRELDRLVAAGKEAYWRALALIESDLEEALHKATTAAAIDMPGADPSRRALDAISLDTIRTTMVYGEGASPSSAQRLVERCVQTATFARVDPQRFVLTHLRRDARAAVRKALGDPHIGSKVRRLAGEMEGASLEEVVAAYRLRYPADKLSTARAEAALSVAPHPNASTFPLNHDDVTSLTWGRAS